MEEKIEKRIDIIQDFLKDSTFIKIMEEAEQNYLAIFICGINTKNNKKVATSLKRAYEFLDNVGKNSISKKYPYLLDESKDYKITKSEPGFNIPVKKNDFASLLDLLIKANEEKKLGFFIDVSHKSPFSENQLIKTQFKNIPPDVDKNLAKDMFNKFGEINNIYHKDGIWTVLYSKINWFLPYAHYQHLKTGSKDRWFALGYALCSFSSKTPCSECNIKGHTKTNCPGKPLIEKLEKEIKSFKANPINPSNQTKNKNDTPIVSLDSDSDLDVSSIELNISKFNSPKKTKKKPNTTKNKGNTPKKESNISPGKKDKDKKTPNKKKDKK